MTYTYDVLGRIKTIVYTSDNRTITFNYDQNGNRVSVVVS